MFIISQVEKFLSTYGWCSIKEFLLSLFPSAKYGTTAGSVSVASVSAFFVHYLGISPALVPALMIILATELFTGIRASTKRGETFQSGKFSRFVIKLCVWMVLFYVAHSFMNEYRDAESFVGTIGYTFFEVLKLFLMSLFLVENITSILENLAVLDGHPKSTYVDKLKDLYDTFFTALKGVFSSIKNKKESNE